MSDERVSRRRALAVLGVGCAAASGAAAASLRVVVAPLEHGERGPRWIRVARLTDLPDGAPRRVSLVADERSGFVTRKAETLGQVYLQRKGATVTALSATCPHLGCTVEIAADGGQFFCPCHSSFFAFDGSIPPGKPNKARRGMDPLGVRVSPSGDVEVEFVRYQVGKATREAIG
ncbi:MAG: Rieske (2Fe-2S) protein [Polyangiaceae bacterium]|nr:Rieske (2Fe-2S) protein [Polyangiaceae bacterium]